MHILIIRPGAIGDTLLTFPIIQAIRNQYGNPHITLVGNPAVLPLALASDLVDKTSDYGQLQWSGLFSTNNTFSPAMLSQLQHTDLVICWLRDPEGVVERNLRLSGAKKVIISAARPPAGKRYSAPALTSTAAGFAFHSYRYAVDRYCTAFATVLVLHRQ